MDQPPILETRSDVQPRLGIIHLLTWTLGSAIILGFIRATEPKQDQSPLGMDGLVILLRVLHAFIGGAALGGLLLWLRRLLWGGPRFPVMPGHWLLLIVGITTILDLGVYGLVVARDYYVGTAVRHDFRTWLALNAVGNGISGSLLLVTIACGTQWRRWQAALGLVTFSEFVQGALCALALAASLNTSGTMAFWAFNLLQWLALFSGVVLLVTLTIDWTQRVHYDWLHYVGVSVWLALVALGWSWSLVAWVASLLRN